MTSCLRSQQRSPATASIRNKPLIYAHIPTYILFSNPLSLRICQLPGSNTPSSSMIPGQTPEQKDGPWIAVVVLENSLLDGQLIARDSQLIQRNIYSTIFRMKCFKIIWTWSCLQKMLIQRICYHCLFWHFYLFKKRVISVFHFSGNKHCLIVHLYRKWNTYQ